MLRAFLCCALISSPAMAQGVLGVIYGRVIDEIDGSPVVSARVAAVSRASRESFETGVLADGSF